MALVDFLSLNEREQYASAGRVGLAESCKWGYFQQSIAIRRESHTFICVSYQLLLAWLETVSAQSVPISSPALRQS